jgi:hypothetical protein
MTVAVIVFVGAFCVSSPPPFPTAGTMNQSAAQAASGSQAPQPEAAKSQADSASPKPADVSKPASPTPGAAQAPSAQNQRLARRPQHKKKAIPSNCNPAPAEGSNSTASGPAGTSSAPANASAVGTAAAAGTGKAPSNCPASKIIVRHGGASEPAIQLAGGPVGAQATQQRATANQMLAATEQNLKRTAGRKLMPSQQDMVNQVRQFMEQSKAAAVAGDIDRARTLAWKAQLLSEELAGPEKK